MSEWAARMRRELAHIPLLSLEELRCLPEAEEFDGGIYFLWLNEELVYIGKSKDISDRIVRQVQFNRHQGLLAGKSAHIPFDRHTALVLERGPIREHAGRMDGLLQNYERAYIAHYEPRCNHLTDSGTT